MSAARLILTCGLPGAGKTTLAKQLAAERGAVRLTKDDWLWALGPTPWATTTQAKVNHELWKLAQEVVCLGLSVVLDFGLAARTERDQVRYVARGLGVGVELHFLDVPVDELWRRIEARNSEPPWDSAPIRRAHLDEWSALSRRQMLPSSPCSTPHGVELSRYPAAMQVTVCVPVPADEAVCGGVSNGTSVALRRARQPAGGSAAGLGFRGGAEEESGPLPATNAADGRGRSGCAVAAAGRSGDPLAGAA